MKSIILSVQRKHNSNIESGIKTEELRKVIPNIPTPFKVYTYESKTNGGRGMVTNEWICDRVTNVIKNGFINPFAIKNEIIQKACVSNELIISYSKNYKKDVYSMHISDLKIYDKPKELGEFVKPYPIKCGTSFASIDCTGCPAEFKCAKRFISRPPQSWQYCEQIKDKE